MNRIELDFEACTGCGACFDSCFVNVFRWDDGAGKPVIAYVEDCVECNKCELACPVEAIRVIPDYAGVYWPPVI